MLKMAAAPVHVVKAASNFVTKGNMFCGSACQCCSYLKEEVQASVSELKSMSEIIKILKDDLKVKVKVVGDSHLKQTAAGIEQFLTSKFEVSSWIKPGANMKELVDTMEKDC